MRAQQCGYVYSIKGSSCIPDTLKTQTWLVSRQRRRHHILKKRKKSRTLEFVA